MKQQNKLKYKQIIFIHLPHIKLGGIPIGDERHKIALSQFTEELREYSIGRFQFLGSSSLSRYFNFLKFLLGFKIPIQPLKKLIGEIKEGSLVFVSHSTYGPLVRLIKEQNPMTQVIVFFHNIESEYALQVLRHTGKWSALRNYLLGICTEKISIKWADKVIVLNERDRRLMAKIYHHDRVYISPIAIKDRFDRNKKNALCLNRTCKADRLSLLFVGTYFMSNREGVEWMIRNITPFVEADFYIVGAGMDRLKSLVENQSNVFITGKVSAEQLDEFYYRADAFICTLFSGGGMKTKVAEAMMFGLPVIGTTETFQGYEEVQGQVGFKSDSATEIVAFIRQLSENPDLLSTYSKNARSVFKQKYSYESNVEIMAKILEIH